MKMVFIQYLAHITLCSLQSYSWLIIEFLREMAVTDDAFTSNICCRVVLWC